MSHNPTHKYYAEVDFERIGHIEDLNWLMKNSFLLFEIEYCTYEKKDGVNLTILYDYIPIGLCKKVYGRSIREFVHSRDEYFVKAINCSPPFYIDCDYIKQVWSEPI